MSASCDNIGALIAAVLLAAVVQLAAVLRHGRSQSTSTDIKITLTITLTLTLTRSCGTTKTTWRSLGIPERVGLLRSRIRALLNAYDKDMSIGVLGGKQPSDSVVNAVKYLNKMDDERIFAMAQS